MSDKSKSRVSSFGSLSSTVQARVLQSTRHATQTFVDQCEEAHDYITRCGAMKPSRRAMATRIILYLACCLASQLAEGVILFVILIPPFAILLRLVRAPISYVTIATFLLTKHTLCEDVLQIISVTKLATVPLSAIFSIFLADTHRIAARIDFVASAHLSRNSHVEPSRNVAQGDVSLISCQRNDNAEEATPGEQV